jgi:hypothetical protein
MIVTFILSNIQAIHFLSKCPRKITLLCFSHHGKNIATYNTQDEHGHLYGVYIHTCDGDLSKTEPARKLTCIFWSNLDYRIFA